MSARRPWCPTTQLLCHPRPPKAPAAPKPRVELASSSSSTTATPAAPALKPESPKPPSWELFNRKGLSHLTQLFLDERYKQEIPFAVKEKKSKDQPRSPLTAEEELKYTRYYESLSSSVKPKEGYTWRVIEAERYIRRQPEYYKLPEIKAEFAAKRQQEAAKSKALVQTALKTCHTWEEFKSFVAKHKSPTHLSDAVNLYDQIGYLPGVFHLLYLA